MNIYLAKLKEKPFPNIKQKKGVSVTLFSDKKEEVNIEEGENDENKEKEENEETEETEKQEEVVQKECIIKDGRNKKIIERSQILETLKSNKIFAVMRKTLPKQMPDIIEEQRDENTEEEQEEDEEEEEKIKKIIDNVGKRNVEEEVQEEEENDDEPLEKKTKKSVVKEQMIYQNVDGNEKLDGIEVKKRMPAREKYNIRTSSYYMNNRKKFISHLIPLFDKYKKELKDEDKIATCDDKSKSSKKSEFNLMIHQRVVKDYLNLHTPYRGLLLFHGLGSGKTCTSIAIAEGLKSQKQVHVLTLASLKANFFDQMKECGDPI